MRLSLLSLEKAAMERWRNGDPMGFVEISANDICYVDPGLTQPIIGLDAYTAYMQKLVGQVHYQRSEFIDPKVVEMGDAALLTYNYRSSTLTPDGMLRSQTPWNTTEVYFKREGEWKIVHNHWSFIRHRVSDSVEVPLPVLSTQIEYAGVLGELMRLESAAMERWRKGDPWGFIELSAPQVTYFDTGTPQRINGREALSAEYRQREGKIFYEVMDFIDPWVMVCDEMAVLFYRFLSTRLNPDGSVASRTPWNCSEVFMQMDGSWRIIHTHWSHIRGERC
jgi:ketosteroid isomerase-like protein